MNTNRNLQLPEPTFPEHELIRDSAPQVELSAGFKARVMAECSVTMASAAKAWRWKVASVTAAVCALGLLVCLVVPDADTSPGTVIKQAEVPRSPGHTVPAPYQLPSSGSHMAADTPKPATKSKKSGSSPANELIDGLNQRKQLFDANMLPTF